MLREISAWGCKCGVQPWVGTQSSPGSASRGKGQEGPQHRAPFAVTRTIGVISVPLNHNSVSEHPSSSYLPGDRGPLCLPAPCLALLFVYIESSNNVHKQDTMFAVRTDRWFKPGRLELVVSAELLEVCSCVAAKAGAALRAEDGSRSSRVGHRTSSADASQGSPPLLSTPLCPHPHPAFLGPVLLSKLFPLRLFGFCACSTLNVPQPFYFCLFVCVQREGREQGENCGCRDAGR